MRKVLAVVWPLALVLATNLPAQTAGAAPQPEATSLLGQPLYSPALSPEARQKLEANYRAARAEFDKEGGISSREMRRRLGVGQVEGGRARRKPDRQRKRGGR